MLRLRIGLSATRMLEQSLVKRHEALQAQHADQVPQSMTGQGAGNLAHSILVAALTRTPHRVIPCAVSTVNVSLLFTSSLPNGEPRTAALLQCFLPRERCHVPMCRAGTQCTHHAPVLCAEHPSIPRPAVPHALHRYARHVGAPHAV